MPHIPDSLHDAHDLELVAAYAAGDAEGAGLEQAAALVASCPECATLHHDLRAIAAAMPELQAPVRSRDFRLTPEQAASLRPGGLRGLLAAFSGPRFAFATPLGTGLAALGIVGVLVASGGFASGAGTGGAASLPEAGTEMISTAAPPDREAASAAASVAPTRLPAEAPVAGVPASAAPSGVVDTMGGDERSAAPAPSAVPDRLAATPEASPADQYLTNAAPSPAGSEAPRAAAVDPVPSTVATKGVEPVLGMDDIRVDPGLALAVALLVLGTGLVSLRWAARRTA